MSTEAIPLASTNVDLKTFLKFLFLELASGKLNS